MSIRLPSSITRPTGEADGPPVQRLFVSADDGWKLDVEVLEPECPPLGIALLGHAMMVDRRSMDRPAGEGFASRLRAAGWRVYLLDVRGRRGSGPSPSEGGDWTYDDIVQRDLPAVLEAVRDREPGLPVVFCGHSLSGHASIAAAGCGFYPRPPDAHVLLSVNMWNAEVERSGWVRLRKSFSLFLFRLLTLLFGRFPSRAVRMGPADEARSYVESLCRFWREGRWNSADGCHDYLAGMPGVPGPVLSLVGAGDDLLAHRDGAWAWNQEFRPKKVDFRVLGRGDLGLPFDPDHMTLVTDPRSGPVWEEIVRWMESATASLRST